MRGAILLHFGHLGSANAAFFIATLVYVPLTAVVTVAAIDAGARSGLRVAQRFMSRYDRMGSVLKVATFLMVVSSGVDLGYVPSHLAADPLAAALFSLDAAALIGSSLLIATQPALRPAAVILLVAGLLAYVLGGVQLDATVFVAKAIEAVALVLVVAALVRGRAGAELESQTPSLALSHEPDQPQMRARRRSQRGRAAGKRSRRRTGGKGREATGDHAG